MRLSKRAYRSARIEVDLLAYPGGVGFSNPTSPRAHSGKAKILGDEPQEDGLAGHPKTCRYARGGGGALYANIPRAAPIGQPAGECGVFCKSGADPKVQPRH